MNLQPAGEYLGEEYHRAGGVPAVVSELIKAGKIRKNTLTVNGKTLDDNCKNARDRGRQGDLAVREADEGARPGFLNLKGNLFDSAIMKTSVISDAFRKRYLSNPKDPNAFEGRAIVFDGPEDYHHRIDDPKLKIDDDLHAVRARHRPDRLSGRRRGRQHAAARGAHQARRDRAALHRRRPAVGHVGLAFDPECLTRSGDAAAASRSCKTGDRVRIDLNKRTADILISKAEYEKRKTALAKQGGFKIPEQPDAVAGNPARHGRRAFAAAWC